MMFFFFCHLVTTFFFHRLVAVFYLCASDSDEQSIFNQIETTNQIMIVSMLQKWNHRYSSHYSIIKFISLEPICKLYIIIPSTTTFFLSHIP